MSREGELADRAVEELARLVLDALARGDTDAFGDLVAEEVEIQTARGVRRGHAEAVAWAANKYDHLQRRYAVDELRPLEPDGVVAVGRTEYAWKESGEVADASPIAIELRFRDGRLALWRFLEQGS